MGSILNPPKTACYGVDTSGTPKLWSELVKNEDYNRDCGKGDQSDYYKKS